MTMLPAMIFAMVTWGGGCAHARAEFRAIWSRVTLLAHTLSVSFSLSNLERVTCIYEPLGPTQPDRSREEP